MFFLFENNTLTIPFSILICEKMPNVKLEKYISETSFNDITIYAYEDPCVIIKIVGEF